MPFTEWQTETRVQFVLDGMPAMTMSLPPQVMGQAVQSVEKLAE